MTWEQLQQFIAEAGEGWSLIPDPQGGGTWILRRPDIQQTIPFRTPEELLVYLRQYARTGDQTPSPAPPSGPPTPAPEPNILERIQEWLNRNVWSKVGKTVPGVNAPPSGAPQVRGIPPEPENWRKVSGGRPWADFWVRMEDGTVKFNEFRAAEFNQILNRLDRYEAQQAEAPKGGIAPPMPKEAPAADYEWYWDGNQWAQRKIVEKAPTAAPRKPSESPSPGYEWVWDGNQWYEKRIAEKAPAKAVPYPEGVRYSAPDRFGNIYYRSSDDDPWKLLTKQNQTVDQALYEAMKKGDQAEIDRLIAIRDQIDNTPAFRASEEQRAIENQRALRREALEAEQLALQRARSPGDWLTWWSMMNREAQRPTEEQFRQFGEARFAGAPGMAGVFQPQAQPPAPAVTPQAQMMFAPGAAPGGEAQAQMAVRNKAIQDEIERRYQDWLTRWLRDTEIPGAAPSAEEMAEARRGIEAQVTKEYPLPATFSGVTGGYGTTNRAIYEEMQRRQARGEPLNQEMIFRGQVPAKETMPYLTPEQRAILDAAAPSDVEAYREGFRRQNLQRGTTATATGGLDWLNVLRSGQPIAEPRLAANIPGVPAYPNPQTWGNLLPSQQEAYKASVEMQGIPFQDYWKQYQEQIPKGYVPPGYMFRRQPSYIRR